MGAENPADTHMHTSMGIPMKITLQESSKYETIWVHWKYLLLSEFNKDNV